MKIINWYRVKRTAIQASTGAGVALLTAIATDFSEAGIKAAVVSFVVTVGTAVLMNIKSQTEGIAEKEGQ